MTEPFIHGESELEHRARLQRAWRRNHLAKKKAYNDKRRIELIELRRVANPNGRVLERPARPGRYGSVVVMEGHVTKHIGALAGLPNRFPCGQRRKTHNLVRAINEAQADAAMRETAQVADQPHRRTEPLRPGESSFDRAERLQRTSKFGDRSTMGGSELGKFILKNFIPILVGRADEIADYQRETYEACEGYARNVWHWNMNKGVPMPSCMAWDFGNGEANPDEIGDKLKDWNERIKAAETAMKVAGQDTFLACRDLILFDYAPTNEPPVRRALQSLHMVVYKS